MKTLQSVLIVASLFLTLGSCDVPGALIGFSRIASRATPPTCAGSVIPVCKDCTTLWKCRNVDIPEPPTVKCKDVYPDRPFCSDGACSATASTSPECQAQIAFRCTDSGYYPDPVNCSRYHLCSAAAAVGTAVATYECPTGFVYNPVTTMCKLSTVCEVVNCSVDPYGYVVYPADNKFFASCTPDEEPLVLKCPEDHIYKPSQFKCVFQCPREGRIADPSNNKKYYECYLNVTIYLYRLLSCVDSYEFDQATERCIPSPVTSAPPTPFTPTP